MSEQIYTAGVIVQRHGACSDPEARDCFAKELIDHACGRLRALAQKHLRYGFPAIPMKTEYIDLAVNEAVAKLMKHMKKHAFKEKNQFYKIAGKEIWRALVELKKVREARYGVEDWNMADRSREPFDQMARRECLELVGRLPSYCQILCAEKIRRRPAILR